MAAPSPPVAAAAGARGFVPLEGPLRTLPDGGADTVALLDDELSAAGEHAEGLLAEAARVLRPGGLLLVSARNRVHAAAAGEELAGVRGFSADELERALGHRGLAVELLCAPGAAASLTGRPAAGPADLALDRSPGLLDAAPRLLAVARAWRAESDRSAAFFTSLPRKIVAAAVLCRDDEGRVLVVHDSFKGHWTIPGGVVDADEDPASGAVREAWEEAGVRVDAGPLLGLFAGTWPDRLVLVFGARPAGGGTPAPAPVHTHEIDGAAWVDLDEALRRVAGYVRLQITRCLERPGRVWSDPGGTRAT